VQWGSFEVDQLNTHPQKLLNEFSLAYMVADFIFFLLPFTPDGGHAHAPPPAACLLCLPAAASATADLSLQANQWTEVSWRAPPTAALLLQTMCS
jgi:hypothetical protein